MANKSDIGNLIILSIVNMIGILLSAFIAALKILDLAKGRGVNTCDLILMVLGITCICFQCSIAVKAYAIFIIPEVHPRDYRAPVLFQVHLWTGTASFWIIACLCVFYCVKITHFNHPFFFWLKMRISKMIPWLLLGSVVGNFVLSVPVYWHSYGEFHQHPATNLSSNSSATSAEPDSLLFRTVHHSLGFVLPVIFAIASLTLILISLHRHTQRMKANAPGFSQSRLVAHFGAARMVGYLLIVFVIYLLAEYCTMYFPPNRFHIIGDIIIDCCSPAQSIILILGNTKLRKGLQKIISSCRIGGPLQ